MSSDASFFLCKCDYELKQVDCTSGRVTSTISPVARAVCAFYCFARTHFVHCMCVVLYDLKFYFQDIGGISTFILRANDIDVFIAFDNMQIQHWRLPFADSASSTAATSTATSSTTMTTTTTRGVGGVVAQSTTSSAAATSNDGKSATLVRAFKAHDAPVRSFAFDSTGALLATASADRNVMVWDVDHRNLTHAFRGHRHVVTCVAFHPLTSRHTLLSGDESGVINRWNLKTRALVRSIEAHASAVTAIVITDDGTRAVSTGRDSVFCVIDLVHDADLTVLRSVAAGERLEAVVLLSGANSLFATAGERGTIRSWNLEGCFTRRTQ
jgi:WD40 repeat protein